MTIAETLLPKLNEWEAAGPDRQFLALPVGATGWALNLSADRVDTLGCRVWEIFLTRVQTEPMANADLKRQAQAVAERATGLMEPLHFIELDELRGEALLRSESPAKGADALAYYEVLMTGGRRITMRRFRRSLEKGPREQVSFALTHEAIAKLVDDLVRE
jgi:hypothetical protein